MLLPVEAAEEKRKRKTKKKAPGLLRGPGRRTHKQYLSQRDVRGVPLLYRALKLQIQKEPI